VERIVVTLTLYGTTDTRPDRTDVTMQL